MYTTIKQQIINWEIKPGTKISEKEVAEKLEVSRTPVREAFLQLAQEELLEIIPQSGTIVSNIDLELVEEARFVRERIETAVAREVCGCISEESVFQLEMNLSMQELCLEKRTHQRLFELDESFHKILFDESNKSRTWSMIRQMNSHFDRLRVLRLAANPNWNVVVSQHKEIFQAIVNNDPDQAEQIMESHLKLVNFEKEELKKQYPDYFK
ncbi:DNA-binding transcriptional regulator, GntR family [Evansella caseinilytica]|uniref:DNA-binding transcriptional regulator, GntR family n=1 Tax=Evansella caseinilytica TaxID=1503961 RepID=A0A1H3UFQ7_9BACI|nr:DNA-binding transcriptional regulator, GntR family [Evansella caseinilytica]